MVFFFEIPTMYREPCNELSAVRGCVVLIAGFARGGRDWAWDSLPCPPKFSFPGSCTAMELESSPVGTPRPPQCWDRDVSSSWGSTPPPPPWPVPLLLPTKRVSPQPPTGGQSLGSPSSLMRGTTPEPRGGADRTRGLHSACPEQRKDAQTFHPPWWTLLGAPTGPYYTIRVSSSVFITWCVSDPRGGERRKEKNLPIL